MIQRFSSRIETLISSNAMRSQTRQHGHDQSTLISMLEKDLDELDAQLGKEISGKHLSSMSSYRTSS